MWKQLLVTKGKKGSGNGLLLKGLLKSSLSTSLVCKNVKSSSFYSVNEVRRTFKTSLTVKQQSEYTSLINNNENKENAKSELESQTNKQSKQENKQEKKKRSLLFKLLKYLLLLPIELIILDILLLYGVVKGIIYLFETLKLDDPESKYYNKDLLDKIEKPFRLIQGFDRYQKTTNVILRIAFDYFLLLWTGWQNPNYWFKDVPDKNSEEFKQQKVETHERNAQRLLDLMLEQRGVYIKVGQFISTLAGFIPDAYVKALSVLKDKAPNIPIEDVRKVIYQDFGKPIEEIFDEFDPVPIGSASIAQVHKAKTKDGKVVAVKVQYPWVRGFFDGDMLCNDHMSTLSIRLYYMQEDAENIDALIELNNGFNKELETGLFNELNFKNEADNAKSAAYHLRERKDVYIPKIVDELTSTRVLTMEYIDGACNANEVDKIKQMGFDPTDISERILSACAEQLFIHSKFHCDPHSSNVFIRKHPNNPSQPQIVLLDHGLYKELTNDFRLRYANFWKSVVLGDEEGIKEYCKSIGVEDYKLYSQMLLLQNFDEVAEDGFINEKTQFTEEDWEKYNQVMQERKDDFLKVYQKMPKEMILIGRADNILRSLNRDLGAKVNRFKIMARAANKGASLKTLNQKQTISSRISLWFNEMRFEMRLFMISFNAYLMKLYVSYFGTSQLFKQQKKEVELIEEGVDLLETPKHASTKFN
ncbi:hypothetical protein ABK040_002861 [Willaertia magna]